MFKTNSSNDVSADSLWQKCLQKISEKIGPASYETWFRTTDFSINHGNANILVPNQFFADFIEEHFSSLIEDVLKEVKLSFHSISFIPTLKEWKIVEPICKEIADSRDRSVPISVETRDQFHPHYTFDRFVVGDGNQMAHAAALAVAEAPGKTSFNPLIIHGGTGLGKTHLLQAVGHFIKNSQRLTFC
jgi:chromosomal replication initiator protein